MTLKLMRAALIAVVMCAGGARAAERVWPVPFRTLAGVSAPNGYHVVTSRNAWEALFPLAAPRPVPGRDPAEESNYDLGFGNDPSLDWSREMVISASPGQKPTAGYAVRITSVARVGREVVIDVLETAPSPDAMVAQVITRPAHVVAVRRLDGPFVFRVNGVRRAPGPLAASHGIGSQPAGLATSLFVIRESGGIAGIDIQTVVRLNGRPLKPHEVPDGARTRRDAQVVGPMVRMVEKAVRDSGFMTLAPRYVADHTVADGMTRTIRVQLDNRVHEVSVSTGAMTPKAFEDVWNAIQTAINSKGTTIAGSK